MYWIRSNRLCFRIDAGFLALRDKEWRRFMSKSEEDKRKPAWQYICFLIFILSVLMSSSRLGAAQFRASVVEVDITPVKSQWLLGYGPRQSTGVHDHLFHRIVAMDDGT